MLSGWNYECQDLIEAAEPVAAGGRFHNAGSIPKLHGEERGKAGARGGGPREGRHCDESVDVIDGLVRERACEAVHSTNELGEPLVIAAWPRWPLGMVKQA